MPSIPAQQLPPLPIPTDPGQLLDRIVNNYGSALLGVAVKTLLFLVVFVVVYTIARIVLVRLTRTVLSTRGFDQAVISLASSVAATLALFGAFALAAASIGYASVFAGFATVLGALSLALGFAAQDLIGNFVAGIFILRDKPFRVGDWIEWNETTGVVRDIQLRVTKLETFDNELITVPNSELADNAVTNPVANNELRVPFTFGIGYGDDIDRAEEIILQEAATVEAFDTDPEPSVIVTELGDSAVGLTARAHITDPDRGKYVNAMSDWIRAVKERFDSEGIDMPYPYTELTGTVTVNETGSDAAGADD